MDLNTSSLLYTTAQEDLLIYEEDRSFGLSEDGFGNGEYVSAEYGGDGHVATPGAEYHEHAAVLVDGCGTGQHLGVSAVAFDSAEELLWAATQGGHVTSYYGSEVGKYTSFQVHTSEEVRSLLTLDSGLLSLTPTTLRCQARRGLPIFSHSSENMSEMQCLLQLKSIPDMLLIGGHTDRMIQYNLSAGMETDLLDVSEAGCAIMRQNSKVVACGDPTGRIDLRDPHSLHIVNSIESHTGSLNDFDLHNNLLVTCGFSTRGGDLAIDNFLMVFDLRMMRAVAPIPTLIDPLLLRFMPSFSSRLAVISITGQMQLLETVTLSEPDVTVYQVDMGTGSSERGVTALDVSTLCQALAVGDSGGGLHVMASISAPVYNPFSRPTELADAVIEEYPSVALDDPLAIYSELVPFPPVIDQPLLSDWPQQFISKRYRRMPMVDIEILRTMKMQGTIGYAPNPNTKRRNQVPDWYVNGGGPPRAPIGKRQGAANSDSPTDDSSSAQPFVAIPKRYRKVDIKYFKSDDPSDIEVFNKTGFAGLEATLPNSYCNAMLQVLYFTEPLRATVCAHSCSIEFCVTCEVGFLFHMLSSSKGGAPCHSGNLLRSLRSAKEASALRLILPDTGAPADPDLTLLIQSWNRFILHQMHSEMLESKRKAKEPPRQPFVYKDTDFPSIDPQTQRKRKIKPELTEEIIEDTTKGETEISKLFGSKQTHVFTCLKCNNNTSKEVTLLAHNFSYPNVKEGGGAGKEYTFCEVVKNSLVGSQVTSAWCETCHKFQPTLQERRVKSLPTILSINCGNHTEPERRFWKEQMDLLVLKVAGGPTDKVAPSNTHASTESPVRPPTSQSIKLCRYGAACVRPSCRFKHPNQQVAEGPVHSGPVGPLHLYYSHSWVPSNIRVSLSSSGEIKVDSISQSHESESSHHTTQIGGTSGNEKKPVNNESKQELSNLSNKAQCVVYDLYAVVCFVNDEKKNVVCTVNVNPSYNSDPHKSHWYIFNDICVTPVSAQEAVWFSIDWKIPCVLYWRRRDSCDNTVSTRGQAPPIASDIFLEPAKSVHVTPLAAHEIPKPGDIVAMDAEFVTLNQEESELRSDGKLSTIRPSHMSVARISCVRGQGELEGTPFIDDYISTQEQVFDYLTKFSGIKPGDLDATCSSKNLTTLKSTYLKIRYLIDNGVCFVGHGLNNDFRVINLVVPSNQVIDTVHLFHLPHQRMVSLRFLAWHFLGLKIQSETHDSIEDARTALALYKKYLQLEAEGRIHEALDEMYGVGKSLQWVVPHE